MITAYTSVFEDKLSKLKKNIKKLMSVPKKDRNKEAIKKLVSESKELKCLLKEMKQEQLKCSCPACGANLINDNGTLICC